MLFRAVANVDLRVSSYIDFTDKTAPILAVIIKPIIPITAVVAVGSAWFGTRLPISPVGEVHCRHHVSVSCARSPVACSSVVRRTCTLPSCPVAEVTVRMAIGQL